MPAFLIVHSATQDGRIDAYREPPVLDVSGLRVSLDWGDITLHAPAGDIPVTIFVTRMDGLIEGAKLTVRAPAGTGTRLTFIAPEQPGGQSILRIDGQWPSDSSMYYYAARDARELGHATQGLLRIPGRAELTGTVPSASAPGPQRRRSAPMAAGPERPSAPTAPVGPVPGSTASVPQHTSHFGREQGARVDPVRPAGDSPVQPSRLAQPPHLGPRPVQQPSFGQRPPRVERDLYGREHVVDDRHAPPIPTPAEFHRLEQEAAEAQRRVYEAWQAQQPRPQQPHAPSPHDGAPQPIALHGGGAHAQPAWYPDPFGRAEQRWFDGRQWTASVMRGGMRATDQPG